MEVSSLFKKVTSLIIFFIIICCSQAISQNALIESYLHQVGDNASIYNGKIETIYNTLQYENSPYFFSPDFTTATIIYRNNYYPNQNVRLDLYKEQLIILPPEKKIGVIANSLNVVKVYMYNKVFVYLNPSKDSGLKTGYYIHLFEGEKIQLFSKHSYNTQQNNALMYFFDRKIQYFLSYNNKFFTIKDKGSFTKLFPQFKKQINQFSKDNRLNFKQNADESLASLSGFCEKYINSKNK